MEDIAGAGHGPGCGSDESGVAREPGPGLTRTPAAATACDIFARTRPQAAADPALLAPLRREPRRHARPPG